MKKIRLFALLMLLILAAGIYTLVITKPHFDAEHILAQSKLNGRSFQGKVQVISALDNRVSAYLMEEHSVPLSAVSFGFDRAGNAYEPKEGVALLAESVLLDGAGFYSRRDLRKVMKEKGIRIGVSAGKDRLSFSFSYVKAFEKEALAVLKAVLYEPHLKDEDIELARQQLAVARKRQEETPQYQLSNLVRSSFYGTHPYGKENIPDMSVLQKVTAEDIRAYLKAVMAKDTLSVGIAGDMDKGESEAFLAQVFSGLIDHSKSQKISLFEPDFHQEEAEAEAPYSAQSFVVFVTPGVKRLDDDFYPLYLADYILGGSGLNSLLNQKVREEKGLTYGIYSGFSNSDAVDLWQVSYSATPENAEQAKQTAAEVYQDFYQNGVRAEALEQAKKALMSSFNLRFSSLINIAEMLEQMQAQKLGADFLATRQDKVAAVTLEAVNDAIRRRMPQSLDGAGGVRIFVVKGKKDVQ